MREKRKMDGQAGQRLSSAVKRPAALHGACHKWGRMYIKSRRRRWTPLFSRSFQSLRWASFSLSVSTIKQPHRKSFLDVVVCYLYMPTYKAKMSRNREREREKKETPRCGWLLLRPDSSLTTVNPRQWVSLFLSVCVCVCVWAIPTLIKNTRSAYI